MRTRGGATSWTRKHRPRTTDTSGRSRCSPSLVADLRPCLISTRIPAAAFAAGLAWHLVGDLPPSEEDDAGRGGSAARDLASVPVEVGTAFAGRQSRSPGISRTRTGCSGPPDQKLLMPVAVVG